SLADSEEFEDLSEGAPAGAAPGAEAGVTLSLEGDSAAHGARRRQLRVRHFSEFSRSRLQQWIESGAVRVDGQVRRPRDAVQMGNRIEVRPQAAPESSAFAPEDVPLD